MAARRYDPERRQRIIDAAIRVVGAKGLAGLSHRTVAAEADVLGSTTYRSRPSTSSWSPRCARRTRGFAKVIAAHGALKDPRADLAGELAGLMGEWLAGDRTGVELEYKLYLAALRRPALRPVAAEWVRTSPNPSPAAPTPSPRERWWRWWTGSVCRCC